MTLILTEHDHVIGSFDAPVNLVEYGDYECPYTADTYPVVKKIQKLLGDKLCFVFRNFPLTKIHSHAYHAAIAAETAASQGRFWEMHHYLFKHQDALSDDNLMFYASKLGIDREKFGIQFLGRVFAPRVDEDIRSGEMNGVTGTPTFFINGRHHDRSWDLEILLDAIAESTDIM